MQKRRQQHYWSDGSRAAEDQAAILVQREQWLVQQRVVTTTQCIQQELQLSLNGSFQSTFLPTLALRLETPWKEARCR